MHAHNINLCTCVLIHLKGTYYLGFMEFLMMINYYRILHAVIVVHGVTSAARKKMTVERCSVKTDLSFELSKWQNTPQNSKEKVKIKI